MITEKQIADRCYNLSLGLNFSLRKLLKTFGLYEANFARIREGECRVREATKKKLSNLLKFLEQTNCVHAQALGV